MLHHVTVQLEIMFQVTSTASCSMMSACLDLVTWCLSFEFILKCSAACLGRSTGADDGPFGFDPFADIGGPTYEELFGESSEAAATPVEESSSSVRPKEGSSKKRSHKRAELLNDVPVQLVKKRNKP